MEGPMRERIDTRTEILRLLCTANRTVTDLARALGISRNAVREHLLRLADEELVRYEAVRRGVGKPAHEYELTSDGELALSRAYLPMLRQLLNVLERQLPAEAVEAMLRRTGQQLAPPSPRPDRDLRKRAEAAVAILSRFGGSAAVVDEAGHTTIQCSCCAIGALVVDHPLACKAMEALLAEYLGVPVQEQCDRSPRPHCRFDLIHSI